MRDAETLDLAELLTLVPTGDESAFATLYRQTGPHLYGVALRITRDRSSAEDVVQDVLTKLWSGAARFEAGRGSPLGWLLTMARNRALDLIARRGRDAPLPEEFDELPDPAEDALSALAGREDADRLRACLEVLTDDQRRAILVAFFEGATHEEVAEQLETPLGTVKSWVRRGLLKLKGCLGS